MKRTMAALAVSCGLLAVPLMGSAHASMGPPILNGQTANTAVYVYDEKAAYDVFCQPGFVTAISLEPGEEVLYVGGGDTARWILDSAQAGKGGATYYQILVKPLQSGIQTNLLVNTNQRTYQLNLIAGDDHQNAVEWVYASNQQLSFQKLDRLTKEENVQAESAEKLNFGYRIKGIKGKASWKPVQAFDDGEKMFFLMPDRIDESPVLYAKRDKKLALVNYRKKGNYYIVDQVLSEAELRIGKETVIIQRKGKDGA